MRDEGEVWFPTLLCSMFISSSLSMSSLVEAFLKLPLSRLDFFIWEGNGHQAKIQRYTKDGFIVWWGIQAAVAVKHCCCWCCKFAAAAPPLSCHPHPSCQCCCYVLAAALAGWVWVAWEWWSSGAAGLWLWVLAIPNTKILCWGHFCIGDNTNVNPKSAI